MPSSPRGHPTSKFVCEIQNQHDLAVPVLDASDGFDGRDHQQALSSGARLQFAEPTWSEMVGAAQDAALPRQTCRLAPSNAQP